VIVVKIYSYIYALQSRTITRGQNRRSYMWQFSQASITELL